MGLFFYRYGKFWSISPDKKVDLKPLFSEECIPIYNLYVVLHRLLKSFYQNALIFAKKNTLLNQLPTHAFYPRFAPLVLVDQPWQQSETIGNYTLNSTYLGICLGRYRKTSSTPKHGWTFGHNRLLHRSKNINGDVEGILVEHFLEKGSYLLLRLW